MKQTIYTQFSIKTKIDLKIYMMFFLTVSLPILSGCSDTLVPATYRGTPIYAINGQINTISTLPDWLVDQPFLVSNFWLRDPESHFHVRFLREQASVSSTVKSGGTVIPPQESYDKGLRRFLRQTQESRDERR